MTVYVYGEPVRVQGTLSDGMYAHSYVAEWLVKVRCLREVLRKKNIRL